MATPEPIKLNDALESVAINGDAKASESHSEHILNMDDVQRVGSKNMAKFVREYYNSGSLHEVTYKRNTSAFDKFILRPRVFKNVTDFDTSIELFGRKIPMPLCVSPTAFHKLAHPLGEIATSQGVSRFGTAMGMSSYANVPWEDIAAQGKDAGTHYVAQMYIYPSRELQAQVVERADRAGCKAIFLTVDAPILGTRWNETRNDFVESVVKSKAGFPNLMADVLLGGKSVEDEAMIWQDSGHSWERDIPYLRSITKMQIFAKGVLTAEDTEKAIEAGLDGIIVSNHGGRQLDEVPATIDALIECVDAAKGRIPIFIDGGFRRGSDIFKAIAIGATCVWVGRPALWGLSYNGAEGVEFVLRMLQEEFRKTMQLMGCRTIKDITRNHLALMDSNGLMKKLGDLTGPGRWD